MSLRSGTFAYTRPEPETAEAPASIKLTNLKVPESAETCPPPIPMSVLQLVTKLPTHMRENPQLTLTTPGGLASI